jgi:hypothetical protein
MIRLYHLSVHLRRYLRRLLGPQVISKQDGMNIFAGNRQDLLQVFHISIGYLIAKALIPLDLWPPKSIGRISGSLWFNASITLSLDVISFIRLTSSEIYSSKYSASIIAQRA